MEKWALKLGLSGEEAEYNQALHWLTSAKGQDPALIGLTQLEGGPPRKIGAAEQLSLGQGCPKSMADGEVQNPGGIGLKRWKLTDMCYTIPKVAPTEVVQSSIEPVGEGSREGDRPAGRKQQNGRPLEELAGWLEMGGVTLVSWASSSSAAAVTSQAEASFLTSEVMKEISLKLKIRLFVSVKSEGKSRDPKSHDGGVRGSKVVLSANFSVKTPPPAGVGPGGAGLAVDHLWRPGEPEEIKWSDRWGGRAEEQKHRDGAKVEQPSRKQKSAAAEPAGQGRTGGVNLPPPLLPGQHHNQASRQTEDLARSVEPKEGTKPECSEGSCEGEKRRSRSPTLLTAATMPTTGWELYLSKLKGKQSSKDQLIQPGQDKTGARRQIVRCLIDLKAARSTLAAEMPVWKDNDGGNKHTLKNYISCNNACLKMLDKFEYLEALLVQYNGVRSEDAEDVNYEKTTQDCVNAMQVDVTRDAKEWEEASNDFVNGMNNAEEAPPAKEVVIEEEDSDDRDKNTAKMKDELGYRPKEPLNAEDGMEYLYCWVKSMKTYFEVSGHEKRPLAMQRALFVANLDAKMTKSFEQELEDRGVESNFTNMLAVIHSIFDQIHPVNQRRAEVLGMKQTARTDWGTWAAGAYDAWRESGMLKLTMEQFMCIWFIHSTENSYIKEELLKLDGDKLAWKVLRKAGQEAQTRIYAKKTANEAAVNKITANGPRRSSGAGAGGGEPKKKLRCFKCNNAHYARDCTADPDKMKCKDCGDTETFRRNPHYTGAYYCPKVKKPARNEGGKPQPGQPPNRRVRKIERNEEGSNTDVEYTDTEGETSDDGYDRGRAANFTGRVDLFGPSHRNSTVVILHRKAHATLMFRQNQNLVPATAEADSGCDFSLMWEKFAKKHKIVFNGDDGTRDKFMLADISGHEVKICGYVDIEVCIVDSECIVGGKDNFVKTRVLIVEGWQRDDNSLILGRQDMKLLGLVGENFPQPMQETSINMECQARAKMLIQMEDEDVKNVNNGHNPDHTIIKEEMGMKEAEPATESEKAWRQAKKLQEREEMIMMRQEKRNGIFLWRAGPANSINRNLMDNSKNKSAEERKRMAEHERERGKYLHLGLQQILYIKKAYDLSLGEIINLVIREDERSKGFPYHSRGQIYDLMKDKSPPCCKLAKLQAGMNSCGLCKPELDVMVTKSGSKSYISTKLAAHLLAAMETEEIVPKTELGQSKCATKARAGEGVQRRIAGLESSVAAGEEDVRQKVRKLHIALTNGLLSIDPKQGGDYGEEGGEQERGRLPSRRDEGHKHPRGNCSHQLGSNGNNDLFSPRPVQVHAETWMLEEEEDSGTYLSGVSDEQDADDEDADDEFASCCSDDVFTEESDNDNGGTAGKVVEFMVPEWMASFENAEYAAEIQQGVPQGEGHREEAARAQPTGGEGTGGRYGTPRRLGWNSNPERI